MLLAINLENTAWTQRFVTVRALAVDRDLIGIADATSRVDRDGWVLLDLRPGVRQPWLGHLLRNRKIQYREPLPFWKRFSAPADAFFRYAVVERDLDAERRSTDQDEPWYDPHAYRRLAGGPRYELRERRDPVLGSMRLDRPWPSAIGLTIAIAPSAGVLGAGLGGDFERRAMANEPPRTLQVRVYSLQSKSRFAVAAFGSATSLDTGAWVLDVDLACLGGDRLVIDHVSGAAILGEVRLLRSTTGSPGACLESHSIPSGIAYLEQESRGEGRFELRAAVLRPEGVGRQRYRLGLHVTQVATGKLFGVWSLDFPAQPRLQRATLDIDFGDRSARATIDGRVVEVEAVRFDQDTGSFGVNAAWWQFDPLAQLRVETVTSFDRDRRGAVRVTRTVEHPRISILAPP
jgi:hypothetical protein